MGDAPLTVNGLHDLLYQLDVRLRGITPKPAVRSFGWNAQTRTISFVILTGIDENRLADDLREVLSTETPINIRTAVLPPNVLRVPTPMEFLRDYVGAAVSSIDLPVDSRGEIPSAALSIILDRVASIAAVEQKRRAHVFVRPVWMVVHPDDIDRTLGDLTVYRLGCSMGAEHHPDASVPRGTFAFAIGSGPSAVEIITSVWFRFPGDDTGTDSRGGLSSEEMDALREYGYSFTKEFLGTEPNGVSERVGVADE
jgi:hypothetical protein